MKDNTLSLHTLVTLLFAALAFKDQLSGLQLGSSGYNLYNVIVFATVVFGFLLYINWLLNTVKSVADVFRHKKITVSFVINLIALLALILIPLGSIVLASSNWLNEIYCTQQVNADPFDPFSTVDEPNEFCRSNLKGKVFPAATVLLALTVAAAFIYRSIQNDRKTDPVLRDLRAQIGELRIFQALTSSQEGIEAIQKSINKLSYDYKLREAALNIKKSKHK